MPGAFLGLGLGKELPVAKLLARLGDPTWREEAPPPNGTGFARWGWEPYDPEAPEGGLGPKGMVLELHRRPSGAWHLSGMEVGAGFQVQPRVAGRSLEDEEGVLAALPGHLDEGDLVRSHRHRLALWRHPSGPGFRTASWLWTDPLEDEAWTQSALAALGQHRQGLGLPWPWSACPGAPTGRIVLPAQVLRLQPGAPGAPWAFTLALDDGFLVAQGEGAPGPSVELSLRPGASAQGLRPGDWALVHGFVQGTSGDRLVMDKLAWHAILGPHEALPSWAL